MLNTAVVVSLTAPKPLFTRSLASATMPVSLIFHNTQRATPTLTLIADCPPGSSVVCCVQLSEAGQTYLIYALRVVGFLVGGVTTALGFYVLISKRDTDVRSIVLDIYRIVFGQPHTSQTNSQPPPPSTDRLLTRLRCVAGWWQVC